MYLRERWRTAHTLSLVSLLQSGRVDARRKRVTIASKAVKDLAAQRPMEEIDYDQLAQRAAQRAKKRG
jgi:hypothetical protein